MVDQFHLTPVLSELKNLSDFPKHSYCIIYVGSQILVRKVDPLTELKTPHFIHSAEDSYFRNQFLKFCQDSVSWKCVHFGLFQQIPCCFLYFPYNSNPIVDKNLNTVRLFLDQDHFELRSIREFFSNVGSEWIMLAGVANHLIEWDLKHTFCGQCGKNFIYHHTEYAKTCPNCQNLQFPRISPAMIIAVLKDNQILLAHNDRFPGNQYSLLAGFVSPGESVEETISREIMEEVGLKVKNIRYFGSQPWPFPDSLMLGYIADWAEGEIKVDNNEITDARWFTPETFPKLPMQISILRKIIEWYRENIH